MADSTELIRFSCPKCEKRLKVPRKWAGKKLKCPKCSVAVKIPEVTGVQSDVKQPKNSAANSSPQPLAQQSATPTNSFDEDDIFGDGDLSSNARFGKPAVTQDNSATPSTDPSISAASPSTTEDNSLDADLFGEDHNTSRSPKDDPLASDINASTTLSTSGAIEDDPFAVDAKLQKETKLGPSSGNPQPNTAAPNNDLDFQSETPPTNANSIDPSFLDAGGGELPPLKIDVLDDEPQYKPVRPKPTTQDYSPLGGFDEDGNFHLNENDNSSPSDQISSPVAEKTKVPTPPQTVDQSNSSASQNEFDLLPLSDDIDPSANSSNTDLAGDMELPPFGLDENSILQDAIEFGGSAGAASVDFGEDDFKDDFAEFQSTVEEYRISCGTCNTGFYQPIDRVGKHVSCPDCFSEFVAPPLPPNWEEKRRAEIDKKKRQAAEQAKREERRLAAVEQSPSVSYDNPHVQKSATQTLQDAERELDAEEGEDMATISEFNTGAWIRRTFGLFTDPMAICVTLVTSILLAVVGYFSEYFGLLMQDKHLGISIVIRIVILSLFGIPSLLVMVLNGYAIMASSANNQRRVATWPLFDLFGHGGEAIAMGVAFISAIIPGGIIGSMFGQFGSGIVQAALVVIAFWLLFPLTVISIMENDAIFPPFSIKVFKSISKNAEAWVTLYFVTGLASTALLFIYIISLPQGPVGWAVSGSCTPAFMFFLTMQIGILASRISDSLSFELQSSSKPSDEEPETDIIEQAKAL